MYHKTENYSVIFNCRNKLVNGKAGIDIVVSLNQKRKYFAQV